MSIEKLVKSQNKRFYRPKELAKHLGVGLSTVWLYSKQKKIRGKKLSSRVTVFDVVEVQKSLGLSDEVA